MWCEWTRVPIVGAMLVCLAAFSGCWPCGFFVSEKAALRSCVCYNDLHNPKVCEGEPTEIVLTVQSISPDNNDQVVGSTSEATATVGERLGVFPKARCVDGSQEDVHVCSCYQTGDFLLKIVPTGVSGSHWGTTSLECAKYHLRSNAVQIRVIDPFLKAEPESGTAPLGVQFRFRGRRSLSYVPEDPASRLFTVLDYGDGSERGCTGNVIATDVFFHSYARPGSYVASAWSGVTGPDQSGVCKVGTDTSPEAEVTISVRAPGN